MMLHGVAGSVFVVLFSLRCVSMLAVPVESLVSVLPGCTGCGGGPLCPTLGRLCAPVKSTTTEKRLLLHRMCFSALFFFYRASCLLLKVNKHFKMDISIILTFTICNVLSVTIILCWRTETT